MGNNVQLSCGKACRSQRVCPSDKLDPRQRYALATLEALEPRTLLAATQLVFLQQPTNTIQGQSLGTIQVAVEDASGNILTNDESLVTVSYFVPNTSIISGIPIEAEYSVNGVASFTGLSISTIGTYKLVASIDFFTANTSAPVQISSSGSHLAFISQPLTEAAEGHSLGTFQVALENPLGNIVSNDPVSVTLGFFSDVVAQTVHSTAMTPASSGVYKVLSYPSLLGTVTAATENGIATFTNVFIDYVGTFSLSAYSGDLPAADSSPVTIDPSGRLLGFSSEPANTNPGTAMGSVQVAIVDPFGNLLQSDQTSVTLTAQSTPTSGGGSPVLHGTTTQPLIGGIATFDDLSLTSPGEFTFTASDAGATSADSRSFIIYTPEPPIPDNLPSITGAALTGAGGVGTPVGGLVMDAKGNLYGIGQGGVNNAGVIYEIPVGASVAIALVSFDNAHSTVMGKTESLAIDRKGNLYGSTYDTTQKCANIFELPQGGHTLVTLTTMTGFQGADDLTIDAVGNLFGAASTKSGNDAVFELPKSSATATTLLSLDSTQLVLEDTSLLLDKQGNLYADAPALCKLLNVGPPRTPERRACLSSPRSFSSQRRLVRGTTDNGLRREHFRRYVRWGSERHRLRFRVCQGRECHSNNLVWL